MFKATLFPILVIILISSNLTNLSYGHANIKFPPTRESKALSGDVIGHPLNMRPQGSCTNMPKGPVTILKPGKHLLRMSFNDGANHIGDCVVYLAKNDAKGSNAKYPGQKIGEMKDCARSIHKDASAKGVNIPGAMEYTIPENPECGDDCVLIWSLTAAHLAPNFEYYDGCADIKIDPLASIDPKEHEMPVVVDYNTKKETPYDQFPAKSPGPLYDTVVNGGAESSSSKTETYISTKSGKPGYATTAATTSSRPTINSNSPSSVKRRTCKPKYLTLNQIKP